MQKKIIPIILTLALLFSSILSLFSIYSLQGNARVINFTGVVRGASQRLVKQELNGQANDALIGKLDNIIKELITGEGEDGLIRLSSVQYQDIMAQMQKDWEALKLLIYQERKSPGSSQLFSVSENFFDLADSAVSAAEAYTEQSVQTAQELLLALTCAFILLSAILSWFSASQQRRQKALLKAEEANQIKSEYLSRMSEDLRAPMNDVSELMYVCDLDNYDLLFLNEAGRKTFHVDKLEGQKCYRTLQGKDYPCEFCTSSIVKEGVTHTWEFTNPLTNRHYLLKDRLIQWEGRPARIEIAFDMTESEKEKVQLKSTLDAEKMITECVRILYQENNLSKATLQVLEKLGSFLEADRAYILMIRDGKMYNDYEWCNREISPQKEFLQELPVSLIDRWIPFFKRQECVIIDDLEELKDSCPEEYRILSSQSIRSLVAAPMEHEGSLCGYLGVDNPPVDKLPNIVSLLQTLCYFLMLAIRHSESQQQLSHLSFFDTLTSFYNRNRYIEDSKTLSLKDTSVGVAYLDVNGLKDINDQYGHAFGDKVLAECASRMRSVFYGADFYRIGGDEFVIICPGIEKETFEGRIQELYSSFQNDPLHHVAIGSRWAETTHDLSQIIAEADALMYEDKKEFYRKNPASKRYRHHSDEILHLTDPAVLEDELNKDHFVVYLQPKILSSDRSAVGAEALIRYRSSSETLVLPGNFLPLLEEAQSISQIDFYVFKFVCAKLKSWMDQGKPAFPVSVNFSRSSLAQPSFVEQLTMICRDYEISPKYLEIEITENIRNIEGLDINSLICKIRRAGFVVAIDDFGTEYANLSLLSSAQFDVLKLDKSMVDDIAYNSRTRDIVESIAEICRKLNINMVAEGIETEEQFAALHSLGIELGQGYLFSKPISADEYEEKYLK